MNDAEELRRELEVLHARVNRLEAELTQADSTPVWRPPAFYGVYSAMSGAIFGLIGAAASLLLNIVGSAAVGKPPLHLIEVYLTFPMGADALTMQSGLAMAIGCCLYLFTGMVLGIPYSLFINGWFENASFGIHFFISTVLSIILWLINFYGILSWLQPLLFGGRWIVDEIPWFVAMGTHLVFGWTMLFLLPFGNVNRSNRIAEES